MNPHWNDPQFITPPNQKVKQLGSGGRKWQIDAYNRTRSKRFAFVAAFCGSGKSVVQVALGVDDVVSSGWKQKQLIVVPQSHIHRGFAGDEDLDYIPIEVNGEKYEWKINHNFCDDKSVDVLNGLTKWLLTDGEELSRNFRDHIVTGINAICSHQALGLVWNKLTPAQKKRAIHNLTLRVDEAHHINGVFDADEEGLTKDEKAAIQMESTNLGDVCRYIFNAKDLTANQGEAGIRPVAGTAIHWQQDWH